jgi:hypothetical protein
MSSRFKKGVPTSSGDYQQATGSQRLATDHSARVLGTRQWLFPARTAATARSMVTIWPALRSLTRLLQRQPLPSMVPSRGDDLPERSLSTWLNGT